MSNSVPAISIVIPLYNEADVLPLLLERLDILISKSKQSMEVILVNDGSTDGTASILKEKGQTDANYHCIFLSRNYGHQVALTAGLKHVNGCEAVMVIDGDLQDPPELLTEMYEKFHEGYEVVYAVRKKRKEGILKRFAYFFYYRLIKRITKIDLPLDTGDFALMSRRVVNLLNAMPEQSRYLRGMRSWVGFEQIGIEYEREERAAGSSKYSLRMLFSLAYNGIFNFSEVPIKFLSGIGFFSIFISLAYFIYSLVMKLTTDTVPSGFTALLFVIILFGGVQLISIGIIGEYIIRTFFQVKNRPLYIVSERIEQKNLIREQFNSLAQSEDELDLPSEIKIINKEIEKDNP